MSGTLREKREAGVRAAELLRKISQHDPRAIARAITAVEDGAADADEILAGLDRKNIEKSHIIGITGPPGAGKSTLTNRLIHFFRDQGNRVGVIAIDPSSALSGGAVLGDRVRMMEHAVDSEVVIRSMASRGRLGGLCAAAGAVARVMAAAGCSPVIIETVGVGQLEMDIIRLADVTALVLAPGLGDDIQAMKAGLLEVVDLLVVNKADCPCAEALVLDLESMLRQGKDKKAEKDICMTTATTGGGVDTMVAALGKLHEEFRASGRLEKRRRQARRLEIVDWAQDFLRQQLLDRVEDAMVDDRVEPRLAAHRIVEEFTRGGE
jgi:LAO/AO transport system kinase